MVVHLPFADVHGFPQVFQVKAELAVSIHTGADVGRSGDAQFPFLVALMFQKLCQTVQFFSLIILMM